MWERPRFLSLGPTLRVCCHHKPISTDASLTGWGAVLDGYPAHVLWEDSHLTHKLARNEGYFWHWNIFFHNSGATICCIHGSHGSSLHQSSGRSVFAPFVQTGAADPALQRDQVFVAKSNLHSGEHKPGRRPLVEAGANTRGTTYPRNKRWFSTPTLRDCNSGSGPRPALRLWSFSWGCRDHIEF